MSSLWLLRRESDICEKSKENEKVKTSADPRHRRRIKRMQRIFASSFDSSSNDAVIDEKIAGAAPEWPLPKISKIDLAILRLAVT